MEKREKKFVLFGLIFSFALAIVLFVTYFLSLYPVKNVDIVKKNCDKYSLDFYCVMAVINVESGFDPNEISDVGAKGLMQLMDSTANEIAQKLGDDNFNIYDTETNIEYGCFYLRYLLNLYDEDYTKALCAYNAGLANVNKWLTFDENIVDNKLNNIPFEETKNYIKKIKSHKKIYKILVDKVWL